MAFNWYLKNHHHNYYSLVEPYRENGKNRHHVIKYLGGLTQDEVQRIRRGLAVMKELEIETVNVDDLIFANHWRYLDVAFLNSIWKQWKLSKIFPGSNSKDVQTSEIAEILTLYRCLDPGSYLSAVDWFNKTALDRTLCIDRQHINKSRIFRELDLIEDRKEDIERYLYRTLKKQDDDGMHIVFYDLTDSYFEGGKCELASAGRAKSNGFRKKRVVLSLLVNSSGYPFAWDILEDYTADVETIKGLSTQWKTEFGFEDNEIVLVFDRGMVSDVNLKHLELKKYTYITALDKNQIPNMQNVNIGRFESINEENMTEQILKMGFKKYDDATYYETVGTVDGRRYVMIFNPEMFKDQRKSRKELIQRAKDYLDKENKALSGAKKSRNRDKTGGKIDKQLGAMKAKNFVDYDLEPLAIKAEGKEINSFHIVPKETDNNREAIKKAERTDGLWTIVTNTTGNKDDKNGFTEEDLIQAYRDKNQIEQAFKDVKSFIKIQPFNVWTPKHVRAHYTICILSYLLDITIANRLKEVDIGVKSTQKVYDILKDGIIGNITIKRTGLNYHGARYYAAWMGRWVSCDPAGLVDGVNLYKYSRNNPLKFTDTAGFDVDAEIDNILQNPQFIANPPLPYTTNITYPGSSTSPIVPGSGLSTQVRPASRRGEAYRYIGEIAMVYAAEFTAQGNSPQVGEVLVRTLIALAGFESGATFAQQPISTPSRPIRFSPNPRSDARRDRSSSRPPSGHRVMTRPMGRPPRRYELNSSWGVFNPSNLWWNVAADQAIADPGIRSAYREQNRFNISPFAEIAIPIRGIFIPMFREVLTIGGTSTPNIGNDPIEVWAARAIMLRIADWRAYDSFIRSLRNDVQRGRDPNFVSAWGVVPARSSSIVNFRLRAAEIPVHGARPISNPTTKVTEIRQAISTTLSPATP